MAEVYYELSPDETADDPVSIEALQQLLKDGTIDMDTRCWMDGMEDWAALRDCDELLPGKRPAAAAVQAQAEERPAADPLAGLANEPDEPQRRQSFAEEFMSSLSPAASTPGSARSRSRVSPTTSLSPGSASARYSARFETRNTVLRSEGGVAAVSVENLLARMETRMEAVEATAARSDKATRDTSRMVNQMDAMERRNRELEKELAEVHQELGGLTQRVTTRVLQSIDLDALERRIVRSDEEHDEKLQRLQKAVEASLRSAEVSAAASLAKHRERYEAEQRLLIADLEASAARQMTTVENHVSRVRQQMDRFEEKFDGDVRPVVERCNAMESTLQRGIERLDADILSTETKLRRASESGLAAAEERSRQTSELVHEALDAMRKDAADETRVLRELVESSVASSADNMASRLAELASELHEGAETTREMTDKRASEIKQTVDVYLKRANEDNAQIKKFTKESVDTLTAGAKELERKAHDELHVETAKLRSVIDENGLLLDPAVAVCKEALQHEIAEAEARSAKDLELIVKRHQKDWEESNAGIELLKTKMFLEGQEVTATIKTLGKDLDKGAH
jgi:hypothetical protein